MAHSCPFFFSLIFAQMPLVQFQLCNDEQFNYGTSCSTPVCNFGKEVSSTKFDMELKEKGG